MRKEKINWKPAAVVYGLMTLVLLIGIIATVSDNNYPVQHTAEVVRPGYESFPETYTVQISPAQAYKESFGPLRVLGYALWLLLGVFMLLASNDMVGKNEGTGGTWMAKNPIKVTVIAGLIAVAFILAGHSNLFSSNNVELSPQEFKELKSKDDFHRLFEGDLQR